MGLPKLTPLIALNEPPTRSNLVSRETERGSCSDNEDNIPLTAKRIGETTPNLIFKSKNSDDDPCLKNKDIFQQSGLAFCWESELKDAGFYSIRENNNTKNE